MSDAIVAKGLVKKFTHITALRGIDLAVAEGEWFGLLGPNGAGKTTAVNILTTLVLPSRGTIRVGGFDIRRQKHSVRRSIGVVFQGSSLDHDLTPRENLRIAGLLYGMPYRQIGERMDDVLMHFGLQDERRRIGELSGGMQRRLEIARAILHRPKILFLDEPTQGLDPRGKEEIWDYLARMREKEHMTLVLTTHYLEEAERHCDRVAILDKGEVIAQGTPRGLMLEHGCATLQDVFFTKTGVDIWERGEERGSEGGA